ncbi:MAG TPA: hypothetical protein VGD98_14390 [Ktedonobacteraceae bacterium]
MQHNTPDRDRAEMSVPNLGQKMPSDSPYTQDEWLALVEAPVKLGRAMMAVSPSGLIGTTQELMALRKSYQNAFDKTQNQILLNMRQHLQDQHTLETMWEDAGHALSDRRDTANVRQAALTACQEAVVLLKKVPAQDAQAYKDFLYATALQVAQAAKEGGSMGVGGVAVSAEEKSLLTDISRVLGLRQS